MMKSEQTYRDYMCFSATAALKVLTTDRTRNVIRTSNLMVKVLLEVSKIHITLLTVVVLVHLVFLKQL